MADAGAVAIGYGIEGQEGGDTGLVGQLQLRQQRAFLGHHDQIVGPLRLRPLGHFTGQADLRQVIALGAEYFQLDTQAIGSRLHVADGHHPERFGTFAGIDEHHAQSQRRGRQQRHTSSGHDAE